MTRLGLSGALALAYLAAASGSSCADTDAAAEAPPDVAVSVEPEPLPYVALRAQETAWRRRVDFRRPPDARPILGPDPVGIEPIDAERLVLLAAQPGELLLLDRAGRAVSRVAALDGARALAVAGATVFVGSPASRDVLVFEVEAGTLTRRPSRDVKNVAPIGARSLAVRGPCLYAADEEASVLGVACGDERRSIDVPRGPVQVLIEGDHLVVTSVLGHRVSVFDLDAAGLPRLATTLVNDGPLFTAAASVDGRTGDVWIVSAGVEDHPLDRRGGSFGYVDSFVYADVVSGATSRRIGAWNVGALGVVTPKAIAVERDGASLRARVVGYGSNQGAEIVIPTDAPSNATLLAFPSSVGITALRPWAGRWAGASSLLDGFVLWEPEPRVVSVAPHAAAASNELAGDEARLRIGELLFFTTLMAPWQQSDGELSRFTCETCHFEGGVDGRIHATGRGDVAATTKPLFGLFNNGPHFTRALDEDLSEMVYAEFEVAAARSGHVARFDLAAPELSWVPDALRSTQHASPEGLRGALLAFLAASPHRPNPRVHGRTSFDAPEVRGADLFEARCASCHAPRLVTTDPESAVGRSDWEALVLSPQGPIVWARDGYEKTGVEPYVHPDGARPSSLRRIGRKVPYFTNGTAQTLDDVVRGASFDAASFRHAGPPLPERFTDREVTDLVAFLRLL